MTKHVWAIKSAAWRVSNAFRGCAVREETFSNALRLELMALLPASIVTREMPVQITFTPSGSTTALPVRPRASRPVHSDGTPALRCSVYYGGRSEADRAGPATARRACTNVSWTPTMRTSSCLLPRCRSSRTLHDPLLERNVAFHFVCWNREPRPKHPRQIDRLDDGDPGTDQRTHCAYPEHRGGWRDPAQTLPRLPERYQDNRVRPAVPRKLDVRFKVRGHKKGSKRLSARHPSQGGVDVAFGHKQDVYLAVLAVNRTRALGRVRALRRRIWNVRHNQSPVKVVPINDWRSERRKNRKSHCHHIGSQLAGLYSPSRISGAFGCHKRSWARSCRTLADRTPRSGDLWVPFSATRADTPKPVKLVPRVEKVLNDDQADFHTRAEALVLLHALKTCFAENLFVFVDDMLCPYTETRLGSTSRKR